MTRKSSQKASFAVQMRKSFICRVALNVEGGTFLAALHYADFLLTDLAQEMKPCVLIIGTDQT